MSDILSTDFSEPGFLKRLRNWRDAMPWLALADCLRPATSVVGLGLCLLALGLSSVAVNVFNSFADETNQLEPPFSLALSLVSPELQGGSRLENAEHLGLVYASRTLTSPMRGLPRVTGLEPILSLVGMQFVLLGIWFVPAGYIMRHAALAVAGRERMATIDTFKMVTTRSLSFLAGPALTIGFALFLSLFFVVLGLFDRIPFIGTAITFLGGIIGFPISLVMGLLLFGTVLTLPLMWASIVCEPYSDGFDSASRGFEYILQRPFRFAAYMIMAIVLTVVAHGLATGTIQMATQFATNQFSAGAGEMKTLPVGLYHVLHGLPDAFSYSLYFSFSAGIYLLLRRDANHQEIEEVWEPERPKSKPLPDLEPKVGSELPPNEAE